MSRCLLTMAVPDRLRGNARKTTHLDRYQEAANNSYNCVLDIPCPFCIAGSGEQCVTDHPLPTEEN